MVDPGTAAVALGAANAGTNLAINATRGLAAARRRFRLLGTFDPEWLTLNLDAVENDDADLVGLSAADVQDAESFLASPQMEPVLAFFAITKMSPPTVEREEALKTYRKLFTNESQRWLANSGGKWKSCMPLIMDRLDSLYNGTLPGISGAVDADEIDQFANFIQSPVLSGATSKSPQGYYLERLIGLASDPSSLSKAITLSGRVAQAISAVDYHPIFTHTELDGRSDFISLYVQRDFVGVDDNVAINRDSLIPSMNPFRMVLMGDPGAGKTTFVQYFKKSISSSAASVPAVEIVCRHYVKSAWDKSLIQHAVDVINTEHAIQITSVEFESMLLLGRVCLVFDGLDEITERTRRVNMISRIESIASQYPACSILVTTRLLGYDRAQLPRPLFTHVRLDQFDEEQFYEYCRRWFESRQRPDLIESFVHDSDTVRDLKFNPLMLSLLCALYREHGAIPTDRRGVYAQCADLLFRRWDSHRQIEHLGAMPKFAERLMQEIARWVYNSPSVQDGVEESQLIKILAHSLVDRDGFDRSDAERDAKSFVEFCAGRAWLLASFGVNHRGQRIFRFTHRTFLEYFAAESFVKRAANVDEICVEILSRFDRDATSVVPELLIQSYESHRDNGGPMVFKELLQRDMQRDTPNLLLLRLMEGISLPSQHRTKAFKRFFKAWCEVGITEAEFNHTLGLNPQAQSQLVREYLSDDSGIENDSVRILMVDAWAGRVLSGSAGRFYDVWNPIFSDVARQLVARKVKLESAVTANWLIALGLRPTRKWLGWDALTCSSVYGAVPGVIWWTIEERLGRGQELADIPPRTEAVRRSYNLIVSGSRVPEPLLADFRNAILFNGAEYHRWEWHEPYTRHPLDQILSELMRFCMCALHEAHEDTDAFVRMTGKLWSGDITAAFLWRDYKVQVGPRPDAELVSSAKSYIDRQPTWLKKWFEGSQSFVLFADEHRVR
ncbi:NACHT domain-containing protein [Rhodococcus jostii]|uniref:NACHT domain-containing protein n=1 Tax=Rhodococcus jostii TaxID=132919 RepID=UPI003639174E